MSITPLYLSNEIPNYTYYAGLPPIDEPFRLHLDRLNMQLNPLFESKLYLLNREWGAVLAISSLKSIDHCIQINQLAERFTQHLSEAEVIVT
jgi:hypothetical protein